MFTEDRETALIKLADFSDNALRLNDLRSRSPESFAWLARKYGPCVAFLIDDLEALTEPLDPLFPVRDATLGALRTAWTRDFRPRRRVAATVALRSTATTRALGTPIAVSATIQPNLEAAL